MEHSQVLQHFDTLAETPDAVAKLRRFILQLAVEGRLLPLDKKVETAKELAAQLEKVRIKAAADG